jgi:hypothetical protein
LYLSLVFSVILCVMEKIKNKKFNIYITGEGL